MGRTVLNPAGPVRRRSQKESCLHQRDSEPSLRSLTISGRAYVAGVHTLEIDLRDLPGGVYFCGMEAGGFTQTRRMVLF